MVRRVLFSAGLLLVLAGTASAQVRLELKFLPGTHTTESTSKVEQKLSIFGVDTETASETQTKTIATIGKRDGAGMFQIQEKIASLQVNMSVMGEQYFFDSANPDNKGTGQLEMLRDVHKAVLKRATTTTLNKDNRVESIKDENDVLGSLPAEVRNLVASQFDAENLKKHANQELEQFPTSAVSPGETWERLESANLGAGQVMTFKNRYKYEGTTKKDGKELDKITTKVLSVDFSLEANSPLPFTHKGSELKAPESEGVILYDREGGRIVESKSAVRITGDMTFVANGQDIPAKLDLKMSSTAVRK